MKRSLFTNGFIIFVFKYIALNPNLHPVEAETNSMANNV
jgi:hypothetical protein